jgi:AbrB family looped-hinge helix DNA binding protein
MDAAGRIVIPRAIRSKLGVGPNTEFEVQTLGDVLELRPVPRAVRLERRGSLTVAVPLEESHTLDQATVDAVLEDIRERAPEDGQS